MRRPAVLLVTTALAATAALAACSSADGSQTTQGTAQETTGTASGTSASATASNTTTGTPSKTSTGSPTKTTPTTKATSTALPQATTLPTAYTDVRKSVKDAELGQTVTVNKIARNLPWPKGYSASAEAYELVGVEMTWTPSTDYTMPIRQQDFVVTSGTATKNKHDTLIDGTLRATVWSLLPAEVSTGNPVTGWMVFRVDPRGAKTLGLDYTRPAAEAGSTDFASKTVSIPLVG